jgi:hypothetical protein
MKVEFRNVDNDNFIHEQNLTFDPRLSPTIHLRRRGTDYGYSAYQVVSDRGHMKLAMDDPEKASLVVYLKPIER